MFQKVLDLYFHTVVLIFREGSTKVPHTLDQIFVDFGVLCSNLDECLNHWPTQILKNNENEENSLYQIFPKLRYLLDVEALKF